MPPYVAQVPEATTANALGARRSIQSFVGIGCPVLESVPRAAQYPSFLIFSFGMDPSTTKTKGLSLPSAARYQYFRNSSPFSYARTGLCKWTLGSPGIAPRITSAMLGCVAAVIETESPSQPRPAVIQRMCTSETGESR